MIFSEEEDLYIRENCFLKSMPTIARELHRSESSVGQRMKKLGLKKTYVKIRFTQSEDRFILENIEKKREWIGNQLNKTTRSIQKRIGYLASVKKWSIE